MKHKIPATPAAWTALGVGLHEAFCAWEQSDRQIDVCEYFEKSYDEYIEDARQKQPDLSFWQIPPGTKSVEASIKNYKKRGLEKDVPLYRDRCLEAEWEIYRFDDGSKALELDFEFTFGTVDIRGSIDRIQWWPALNRATIEDTKTGNLEEWDFRQLGTYSMVATEIFDIPINWGRFWFTKIDRGGDWVDLSRYTYDYLEGVYITADSMINKNLFLPNPGKQCQLCGVRPYCRELGWLSA